MVVMLRTTVVMSSTLPLPVSHHHEAFIFLDSNRLVPLQMQPAKVVSLSRVSLLVAMAKVEADLRSRAALAAPMVVMFITRAMLLPMATKPVSLPSLSRLLASQLTLLFSPRHWRRRRICYQWQCIWRKRSID